MKAIKHFKKIMRHKYEVCKICFKFGLYRQGLTHDLSKFHPKEFFTSVKYYQGNKSPIEAEKLEKGYSLAWLHHFHNNPHHWAYWIDFDMKQNLTPYKIPYKYMIESIADWIGAGKAYGGKNYTLKSGFEYYRNNIRINNQVSSKIWHKETRVMWDIIMTELMTLGYEEVVKRVKDNTYKNMYNGFHIKENSDYYYKYHKSILDKYFK